MSDMNMTAHAPEIVAINALNFIASDPQRLERFLSVTGIGPATLRSAAAEPAFLAQIMDYVASDEALLLSYAANANLVPEVVARAHVALQSNPGTE